MPIRLNDHLLAPNEPKTPTVVPPGVNSSLGQVAPAIPLDPANSRARHGHHHVHDSIADATGDSSDDTSDETDVEDADPDCGDDDDCEENAIHIS